MVLVEDKASAGESAAFLKGNIFIGKKSFS